MTDNIFFELFNEIDDKYIEEAASITEDIETYKETIHKHSRIRTALISIGGAAACAALVFGITKLPGIINKLPEHTESLTPSAGMSVITPASSNSSNDSFEIKNVLEVTGTPLPESELADFTYEEILDNYRKILTEDAELTAVLKQINNPDFTERYYRARTLADMLEFVEGAKIKPFDRVWMDYESATVMSAGTSSTLVFNESGYTFESFKAAFYDVFGGDSAVKLLKRYSRFREYNGGLYYVECKPNMEILLVHTDYELKTNTDSEIVFDTVCYWTDWDKIALDCTSAPGKPEFDPAKIDEYTITRISNRFIKENGKWKAEEVYMSDGVSSAWDTNIGNIYTDDHENRFVVSGTPLSESELADFDFEEMVENFRYMCGKDDELTELLESIGRPEITELYYKAGALADPEGFRQKELPLRHKEAYIGILENTPPSISGTIIPSYTNGQTFVETGVSIDSYMNVLYDVFYGESAAMMLAHDSYYFTYNGQLFNRTDRNPSLVHPVHMEYRLCLL